MTQPIISKQQASAQQLSQYFTGVACANGHVASRNTKSGRCMECQREHGAKFRAERPEVMKQWRERNPEYASNKYHEQVEVRRLQNKEWYEANKKHALSRHKRWYYADGMAEKLLAARRDWYAKNPTYDDNYRKQNKDTLLKQAAVRRPKLAALHKERLQQTFERVASSYKLPENPTERDLKYWLAGEIISRTGWVVNKEVWLDDDRSSRIDLLIPEAKLGLELKLSNKNWVAELVNEQQQRYQQLLEQDGYLVIVVSLDGSIGIGAEEFLSTLPRSPYSAGGGCSGGS